VNHQNQDGSFDPVGFICHKDMVGGLQGKAALTAYTTIALLRAGETSSAAEAVGYLEGLFNDRLGDPDGANISKGSNGSNKSDVPDGSYKIAGTTGTTEITDAYTLALTAYAFELAQSRMKDAAYTRLMELAQEDDHGLFWISAEAQIETTAYALLALVEHGDGVNAGRAAKWLVSRRNSRGGFSTTQDTVVALEALTSYSKGTQADVDLVIEIDSRPGTSAATSGASAATSGASAAASEPKAETKREIRIGSENSDVLQMVEVPTNEEITVKARGKGDALIQITRRFNLPVPPKTGDTFKINVGYDAAQVEVNDLVKVSVEVEFTPPFITPSIPINPGPTVLGSIDSPAVTDIMGIPAGSGINASMAPDVKLPVVPDIIVPQPVTPIIVQPPIKPPVEAEMVVLDISIPTGFTAVTESLEELLKTEKKIKRYEVAGRKVIIFVENMLAGEKLAFAFNARAMYPVKAKAAGSQVYSYYQPQMKGETLSREITVLEH